MHFFRNIVFKLKLIQDDSRTYGYLIFDKGGLSTHWGRQPLQ